MRLLTVLAGALLAGAGAFCFQVYAHSFAAAAFILGTTMLVAGFFNFLAYVISTRKTRLPDTVLVEGLVNVVMGFVVVNNQVLDSMVIMFFGIWILFSGATRFSQAFAVSRINPKHWFTVVPLSIVNTILGLVMLMPSLISDIDSLVLTGAAFVLNGFSVIIYAMYMVKKLPSQKAEEAHKRAKARQLQEQEKRQKRDELRKMSKDDRDAARKAEREREDRIEAAKLAKKEQEKEEKRSGSKLAEAHTLQLSAEEIEEIRAAAPAEEVKEAPKSFDELWEMTGVEEIKDEPEVIDDKPAEITIAHWNKPTDIPSLRAKEETPEPVALQIDTLNVESKRAIVNLEEVEKEDTEVEFETIELPEVEIMSEGGEARKRDAILSALEETRIEKTPEEDLNAFKPLTVEELFADEQFGIKPLSDPKATATDLKLTQTFTFDWLDKKKER